MKNIFTKKTLVLLSVLLIGIISLSATSLGIPVYIFYWLLLSIILNMSTPKNAKMITFFKNSKSLTIILFSFIFVQSIFYSLEKLPSFNYLNNIINYISLLSYIGLPVILVSLIAAKVIDAVTKKESDYIPTN